jgi:hypothetical protein
MFTMMTARGYKIRRSANVKIKYADAWFALLVKLYNGFIVNDAPRTPTTTRTTETIMNFKRDACIRRFSSPYFGGIKGSAYARKNTKTVNTKRPMLSFLFFAFIRE